MNHTTAADKETQLRRDVRGDSSTPKKRLYKRTTKSSRISIVLLHSVLVAVYSAHHVLRQNATHPQIAKEGYSLVHVRVATWRVTGALRAVDVEGELAPAVGDGAQQRRQQQVHRILLFVVRCCSFFFSAWCRITVDDQPLVGRKREEEKG